MSNYIIRPLRKEDNEAIAAIVRSVLSEFKADKPGTAFFDSSTDNLFAAFKNPKSAYWVIESDVKVVGGGGIFPTEGLSPECCELVKLYLLPQARGIGLGKALIETCCNAARQFGFTHVYLESMPELSKAVSLYKKTGFEYQPEPLGNSGHFGCNLWMLKKL